VGVALQGSSFALVLCSPLRRARRTADLAGFSGAEVDPGLAEWDYGGYEGLTTAQIRTELGHPWTVFTDGVPPGETPGESLAQVGARADRVIARARAALAAGDVLLFSHGHLLRVLGARWVGADPGFGGHLGLSTATIGRLATEHDVPVIQEWNRTP
jgi:probable phosphoglycerate mutase